MVAAQLSNVHPSHAPTHRQRLVARVRLGLGFIAPVPVLEIVIPVGRNVLWMFVQVFSKFRMRNWRSVEPKLWDVQPLRVVTIRLGLPLVPEQMVGCMVVFRDYLACCQLNEIVVR